MAVLITHPFLLVYMSFPKMHKEKPKGVVGAKPQFCFNEIMMRCGLGGSWFVGLHLCWDQFGLGPKGKKVISLHSLCRLHVGHRQLGSFPLNLIIFPFSSYSYLSFHLTKTDQGLSSFYLVFHFHY